jgi:hypothetical protein
LARELDLHGRKLAEPPQEIGELVDNERMRLNGNGLTRPPPEIGQLTNLVQFDIDVALVTVVVREMHGEGFGAVAGDGDGVEDVVFLECPDGKVPVARVVLDEHDLLVIQGPSPPC